MEGRSSDIEEEKIAHNEELSATMAAGMVNKPSGILF